MMRVERFAPWCPDERETLRRSAPQMSHRCPVVSVECHHDTVRFELSAPWWRNPSPHHTVGSCDRLWEHEVVEIFFVGEAGHYLELEVGPYGHHLALQLSAPRVVTARDLPLISLQCERVEAEDSRDKPLDGIASWNARGVFDRALLPSPLESKDGRRGWNINMFWCFSYGASRHHWCATPLPGERPDFHQPEHFSLHFSSEQEQRA